MIVAQLGDGNFGALGRARHGGRQHPAAFRQAYLARHPRPGMEQQAEAPYRTENDPTPPVNPYNAGNQILDPTAQGQFFLRVQQQQTQLQQQMQQEQALLRQMQAMQAQMQVQQQAAQAPAPSLPLLNPYPAGMQGLGDARAVRTERRVLSDERKIMAELEALRQVEMQRRAVALRRAEIARERSDERRFVERLEEERLSWLRRFYRPQDVNIPYTSQVPQYLAPESENPLVEPAPIPAEPADAYSEDALYGSGLGAAESTAEKVGKWSALLAAVGMLGVSLGYGVREF